MVCAESDYTEQLASIYARVAARRGCFGTREGRLETAGSLWGAHRFGPTMHASMDKFTGCLLGLALGDALGAPFEGGPIERFA
jgi:hypothetical protein